MSYLVMSRFFLWGIRCFVRCLPWILSPSGPHIVVRYIWSHSRSFRTAHFWEACCSMLALVSVASLHALLPFCPHAFKTAFPSASHLPSSGVQGGLIFLGQPIILTLAFLLLRNTSTKLLVQSNDVLSPTDLTANPAESPLLSFPGPLMLPRPLRNITESR